jgi:diacylglycerol kinase family enzyme
VYITVFPSGSGNDFVKSLPHADFVEFYPGVFQYESGKRYFLNALGTGLDAYTAYYASDVKGKYLRGVPAYAYGLIKTMMLGASTASVKEASIDIPSSLSIMAFGRGSYVGGGFYLLPHASVKERSIAWLVASYITPVELLRQVPILFNGKILDYEKVFYGHADRVEVKLEEPKVFQIDGEIIKGVSQFSVYTADTPVYIRYIKPI